MRDDYENYGHTGPARGSGGTGEPQSPRLWESLARAGYGIADPSRPVPPVDGRMLAEVLNGHAAEQAYHRSVAQAFVRLASELRHERGTAADHVRQRLSELTTAARPEVLRALVAASGEAPERRAFLEDAAAGFPIDALLRLVLAAASDADYELSRPLVRLLYKLAIQTRVGPPRLRAGAETALREELLDLIGRWWMIQSGAMSFGFEDMFHATAHPHNGPTSAEPERMVQMAVEVDAVGMPIWGPVTRMLSDGRFHELLDLLRDSAGDSRAARAIAQHVATPQRLSMLLDEDEVDFESVDRLLEQMGLQAVPTLLDRLATAESRATRRGIFDRLVRFGPAIGPAVFERLGDKRWFVQRNILALLAELQWWPEEAPPDLYIGHEDPRVRKEAIRTLLRVPRHRERALVASLRDDTDRQTLRMVMAAAQEDCPDSVIPVVVKRLGEEGLAPDLKVAAVRLLGGSASPLALEALLRLVSAGRTMFGKPKLAEKSSEMLAALRALAARWSGEPRAAAVLERAAASRDVDLVDAATVPEGA